MLADDTRQQLRTLLEQSASAGDADADARKIGDYYSSFMDEAAIESRGISSPEAGTPAIAGIKDRRDLARVIGSEQRADVDALNNTNFETSYLFGIWITQGLKDPSKTYPYLLQGGLGLPPDRDYYLSRRPPHGPNSASNTRATSRRYSGWRGSINRRNAPPASSRSKPRWRRRTPRVWNRKTYTGQVTWKREGVGREGARGSTGPLTSRQPG